MEIDSHKISDGSKDGQMVWICDLRYDNYNEKPIRHVRPTHVLVRSNSETTKKIYYSSSHFVELNKKGEPVNSKVKGLFDNTGFRGRTGTPLRVFDNEADCKKAYTKQVAAAVKGMTDYKNEHIKMIDLRINELKSYV